jgi:hypothetical protein
MSASEIGRIPDRQFAWTLTARGASGLASVSRSVDTGSIEVQCTHCARAQTIDFGELTPAT